MGSWFKINYSDPVKRGSEQEDATYEPAIFLLPFY
jgi:hypothetical protein